MMEFPFCICIQLVPVSMHAHIFSVFRTYKETNPGQVCLQILKENFVGVEKCATWQGKDNTRKMEKQNTQLRFTRY